MSVVDDIASAFQIGVDVVSGKRSIHDVGEAIFGDGKTQQSARCPKSPHCALGPHAEGECKPVRPAKSKIEDLVDVK